MKATIDFEKVGKLYTALRKNFVLASANTLFPDGDKIDKTFDSKKANASDLAQIMYKILKKWGLDAKIVWIRDNRKGVCQESVPSEMWFDRLGILVTINGKEKLFDFNRAIPSQYEMPWFLNNTKVLVLDGDKGVFKNIRITETDKENISYEKHSLSLLNNTNLVDTVIFDYKGKPAEELRDKYYSEREEGYRKNAKRRIS